MATKKKAAKQKKNGRSSWAILVYIAADDTLANFAIESLKQLSDDAGPNVVVAAQLGFEGSKAVSRRYLFRRKGDPTQSIEANEVCDWGRPPNNPDMADPRTLREFINWAHSHYGKSKNYCLILWGHGPELLHEAPTKTTKRTPTAEKGRRLYFTPVELREAFEKTPFNDKNKLEIIEMDACSMSLVEFAYELKHVAKYMVASQEYVPDLSFPYDTLLEHIRKNADTPPETLCKESVKYYIDAYQDYFWDLQNGLARLTLSAVRLDKIDSIVDPLQDLLKALPSGPHAELDGAILKARKEAQGFVGGLFVDLGDFCKHLSDELERLKSEELMELKGDQEFAKVKSACDSIKRAIAPKNGFIVENRVAPNAWVNDGQKNGRAPAHNGPPYGISIYFPYLTNDETKEIEASILVEPGKGPSAGNDTVGKGPGQGDDTIGKGAEIVNTAARSIQYAVRWEIISETEEYYDRNDFDFKKIGWGDFIAFRWSRILAEKEPRLDLRYSGQQCAVNLLRYIESTEKKPLAKAAGQH